MTDGSRAESFSIHHASEDDLPAVLAFWLVAAENANRPSDSLEALRALLARDREALMLALIDGAIVGSVIAGWDGWRCHVYRLAVRQDLRRQGIGRLLLDACERRFATTGCARVDAMVLDDNALAGFAWAAAGYERQPEWSRWIKRTRE